VTARVWLVGEHNPYGSDPRFALYPYPPNSAGGRLARVLGIDRRGYLGAFERRNLLDVERWSAPAARDAAARVRAEMADGDSAVLLGARVAAAFGFTFEPLRVHRRFADGRGDPDLEARLGQRGIAFLLVPHPSGRSRAWNDPALAPRVRAAVAALRTGDHLVEAKSTCRQCFEEYPKSKADDGFCSDSCAKQYDRELGGSE
jgi:hypothetical protein